MRISTTSESSRTVISRVFSALYAGITTAIFLPLIIRLRLPVRLFSHLSMSVESTEWHAGNLLRQRVRDDLLRWGIGLNEPGFSLAVVADEFEIAFGVHGSRPDDFR